MLSTKAQMAIVGVYGVSSALMTAFFRFGPPRKLTPQDQNGVLSATNYQFTHALAALAIMALKSTGEISTSAQNLLNAGLVSLMIGGSAFCAGVYLLQYEYVRFKQLPLPPIGASIIMIGWACVIAASTCL